MLEMKTERKNKNSFQIFVIANNTEKRNICYLATTTTNNNTNNNKLQ